MNKLMSLMLFFLPDVSFSYSTGLIKNADRHLGKSYVTLGGYFFEELPAKFDLRETGHVSEVKNQGSCGSCWSFGTIDSLESSMRLFGDGLRASLSQQQLVNCYFSGCGGGYFAFEKIKANGVPNYSLEPYTARNGRCKQEYQQEHSLDSAIHLGSPRQRPTTNEIRASIYHFGAVAVTVTAGSGMKNYKSGVASRCSTGSTNHIVTLVGWNEDGTWILKNSWGTGWGMRGYGNWPINCDRVGEEAAVSIYRAVPVANMIQLANLPEYTRPGSYLSVPFNPDAKYAWYVNDKLKGLNNILPYRTRLNDRIRVIITMPDAITESETLVK